MEQETRRVPPEMVEATVVVVLVVRACPSQLPRQPPREVPARLVSNWTRIQNQIHIPIQERMQCSGWAGGPPGGRGRA